MLFRAENVTYSRAGRVVLDGFSAELPEGASCIVGPSGSGKSTLLRLLNRLADPDSGRITFRGEDISRLEPRELRREACLVPQLPALVEGTVAENLRWAASLGQAGDPDARIILPRAGLGAQYADREANELSVGEQQRVMLARALAVEPRVLLLDEPTSALDEDARADVERALHGLRVSANVSLVVVTHDIGQAERLADHVVRMDV